MAEAGAINEVRALLRQFIKSDYRACQVRTASLDLFFSRDAALRPEAAASAVAISGEVHELTAPHIGTLAELAPPGTLVPAGGVYGKLAVLDELRDLVAQSGGVIAAHCGAVGELIEYGQPVAMITG